MTRNTLQRCQRLVLKLFADPAQLRPRQTEHHFSSFHASSPSHYVPAQDWKLFLFRLWENVLLTRYIASLQYFPYPIVVVFGLLFVSFFRRQWKSISMFWCFHLLCPSRSHSGTTPCCVLDKTMIMFYENEIFSKDSRI